MHSAIYTGRLRHRRFAPREHSFEYRLFMMYVDLAELDQVFRNRWLWSVKRPSLAWLRRADYLGDASVSLDQAVRDRVETETGERPTGPIRMLTHLRYFGVGFNPVTIYYCFDRADTHVETVVAEITNTPWNERHAYVLVNSTYPNETSSLPSGERDRERATSLISNTKTPSPPPSAAQDVRMQRVHGRTGVAPTTGEGVRSFLHFRFDKTFHVSPFMAMNYEYDWRFSVPTHADRERLTVHMQNMQGKQKSFDATLDLQRREITGWSLATTLTSFPAMTVTVIAGIYWQALRLWLKRIPFHSHPDAEPDHERHTRRSSIT
jgi:DUF1365 family protein